MTCSEAVGRPKVISRSSEVRQKPSTCSDPRVKKCWKDLNQMSEQQFQSRAAVDLTLPLCLAGHSNTKRSFNTLPDLAAYKSLKC